MSREILYSVNRWGIIKYRISHFVRNDKTGAFPTNDNLGGCLLKLVKMIYHNKNNSLPKSVPVLDACPELNRGTVGIINKS